MPSRLTTPLMMFLQIAQAVWSLILSMWSQNLCELNNALSAWGKLRISEVWENHSHMDRLLAAQMPLLMAAMATYAPVVSP